MKLFIPYIQIAMILLLSTKAYTQEYSLEYNQILKLHPRIQMGFGPKMNFETNETEFIQKAEISTFVKLKLNDFFRSHIGYQMRVYSAKYNFDSFENDSYRLYGDITYKILPSQKDYEIQLRYMAQLVTKNNNTIFYNRARIKFDYTKYKHIVPYCMLEVYTNAQFQTFEQSKLTLGIQHNATKHLETDYFFRIQTKIENTLPTSKFEIGCVVNLDCKMYD